MIRELVTKLSGIFEKNSHSARRKCDAPVKLSFEPVRTTGNLHTTMEGLAIIGELTDLSKTGIGFLVSSIRLKEYYLVGQDRRLNAELDLPGGKIKMKVVGRRYTKVGQHLSTEKYLIGAEIVDMTNGDRQAYEQYLRYGSKPKSATAPSLEMGID